MSKESLRGKVIRLAHDKPHLREKLLPLVKSAGAFDLYFTLTVPLENGEVEAKLKGDFLEGEFDKMVSDIEMSLDGERIANTTLEVKGSKAKYPNLVVSFGLQSHAPFSDRDVERATLSVEKLLLQAIAATSRTFVGQWAFGDRVNPNDVTLDVL